MFKKQIIVLVLTVSLLMVTASPGSAANFIDIDNNPQQDAINEMARLGILEGVGNNLFAPNAELNRAAAAKVAGYLLGYTEEEAGAAAQSEPIFSDIVGTSHAWALGWINLMAEEGILRGVGDNRYAPGDPLQMVHWTAILMRILEHEQPGMSWPNDYNDMANNLGLERGLYYSGSNIMNRAEMARMTTTALYSVNRPDGNRIIDMVTFAADPLDDWHVPEQPDTNLYDNADIKIALSDSLVPAGGGQTITITVTATHGADNQPAAFTNISFFAAAGPHDRNEQLSAQDVLTDANGVASTTYTTLAADDNATMELVANIATDGDWLDKRTYALASDKAAFINGRVINPFTGNPAKDVNVAVDGDHEHIRVSVDDQGYYSAPVIAGTHYVNFNLNVGSSSPYPGEYRGSHFSINNNGDVWLTMQRSFTAGNSYTLPSEMGIVTGISSFSPGTEIFITEIGTNNTFIAVIGADKRFMITLPPGSYEIGTHTGAFLARNVNIQKGAVTEVGSI